MIEIQQIVIKAGQFNVKDCSLKLTKSKIHVLLGPSGSGKTLLLEAIAGIRYIDRGSIHLFGKDVTSQGPEKRQLAYMPQDYALFPHLNVRQNIAFGLQYSKNVSASDKQEKIESLASLLDIGHLLHRGIKGLSGGEQQRVALARALAVDKPLLLMDEPFSSLHESMAESLSVLLLDIMQKIDLTILMTTHQRDHAYMLADYIHLMSDGILFQSIAKPYLPKVPIRQEIATLLGINNTFKVELTATSSTKMAYSADLEGLLELPYFAYPSPAPQVLLGIHPADVVIHKSKYMLQSNSSNEYRMKVDRILYKETTQLLLLRNPNTGYLLRAERPIQNNTIEPVDVGEDVVVKIPVEGMKLLV